MNEVRKIMVLGAGDLGRRVFHELAHTARNRQVQLVGRNEDVAVRACNLARFCGMQRGLSPRVTCAITDLRDVARTAECIARFQPDVLFLAASYQSWWVISTLPQPAFQRLYAANYGPWLPMHLAPTMKAMESVRQSGCGPVVVNAAYPDAVHPVLAAIGLSPHVGIGNLANNVPGIRVAAADQLGCNADEIEVRLIAHHYVSHRLSRRGDSGRARMSLTVVRDGRDVTATVDVPDLLSRLPREYRRTGGLAGQAMTAASALSVLEPLIFGRDAVVHAPGPGGRAGGYPVAIDSGHFRVLLPGGTSEAEAIAINISGQVEDGITEIRPDGSVVFGTVSMGVLTEELGYACAQMAISEVEECAAEISARFAEYQKRMTT